MKVGVVGAGHIGGNVARQVARAGHDVTVSFRRDRDALERLAADIGARAGTPAEAVAGADAVVLSVPWPMVEDALRAAGPLSDLVLIDTTNQYGRGGVARLDGTAAAHVASLTPDVRHAKTFNTLTSAFQASVAGRPVGERPAMFLAGDDDTARDTAAALVAACGFVPVAVGGYDRVAILEAPRRDGAVYGEEYAAEDARRIAEALRNDPAEAARLAMELRRPG